MIGWVEGIAQDQRMNASVDGRWAKQSEDAAGNPLGMVNVLAHDLKLCLARWPMTEKRYEPRVLRDRLFECYPGLRLLTMDALYAERGLCQAMVSHGRDHPVQVKGNRPTLLAASAEGFPEDEPGEPQAETREKSGQRRDTTAQANTEVAGYIREEPGVPGAQQAAVVEKVRVAIATGEASKECWYLLTSPPPHRCSPREMLRLFRNHWSIENNLHQVKDRSWDEDRHTPRRPGLGEVFTTLVNVSLNAPRLEGWFPSRMSMPLRAKTCAFRPTQTIAQLFGRSS